MPEEQVRLTQLTHGGGGGCKVAPDILEKILSGIKPGIIPPQLLSGRENSDDAAVYQISAQQAIVATTDFFTPIIMRNNGGYNTEISVQNAGDAVASGREV